MESHNFKRQTIKDEINTVEDIVEGRSVLSFKKTDKVRDIMQNFLNSGHKAGLVEDSFGGHLGMITEREIIRKVFSYQLSMTFNNHRETKALIELVASDVVIKKPFSFKAGTTIDEAYELFTLHGYKFIPVLNTEHSIIGIADALEVYEYAHVNARELIDLKDKYLTYFMGSENYGCAKVVA